MSRVVNRWKFMADLKERGLKWLDTGIGFLCRVSDDLVLEGIYMDGEKVALCSLIGNRCWNLKKAA
jgi:hypothetical protein